MAATNHTRSRAWAGNGGGTRLAHCSVRLQALCRRAASVGMQATPVLRLTSLVRITVQHAEETKFEVFSTAKHPHHALGLVIQRSMWPSMAPAARSGSSTHSCNNCGASSCGQPTLHLRCTAGCDFDFCSSCATVRRVFCHALACNGC